MASTLPLRSGVALESRVAFLRQPTSFSDPSDRVEAIEANISSVFLTERHAGKLKKPVCQDVLDFLAIAARQQDSQSLADFYRAGESTSIDAAAYRAAFVCVIDRKQQTLARPGYRRPRHSIHVFCAAQPAVLHIRAALSDARIREVMIVEGNGEL